VQKVRGNLALSHFHLHSETLENKPLSLLVASSRSLFNARTNNKRHASTMAEASRKQLLDSVKK
jgi:hypothetical protein